MKDIYLIRHGKPSLDGADRERGLTTEGEVQAKQIAELLSKVEPNISKLFASPFQRAILFIKPFTTSNNIPINEIEEFREITFSTEKIDNLNEQRKKMWSDFSLKLPGGESASEAQSRAFKGLNQVLEQTLDNSASAVVSHGFLIGLIINSYDSTFGFDDWKAMTMPDVFKLNFTNEKTNITHIGCEGIDTFKI